MLFFTAMILVGCGGNSEWKGSLTGAYKLSASASDRNAPALDTGKALLTFTDEKDEKGDTWNRLKLGPDSPLPNCTFLFFPGSAKRDAPGGVRTALVYKANLRFMVTDAPSGLHFCMGRADKDGKPEPVEIQDGEVTIDEGGKLYGLIEYTLRSGAGEKRAIEITGSKGWF